MKSLITMLAAAGVVATSLSVLQAQPYYVAGNYNGWSPSANVMTDDGAVGINGIEKWEYTVTGQTPNSYPGGGTSNNGFKITDGTWNNTWPGSNLQLMYDLNGSATIYFYPGTITPADGWSPLANRVGYADTGAAWEVIGDFTSPATWVSDPNAQMTLQAGSVGVYTNIYTVAVPGTYSFKFRTPGTWDDASIGSDFGDGAGNAAFVTTTPNQAVLFQLDLPNGRFKAGNNPVPPVTNYVVFAVDMSAQIQLGYFTPGSSVYVAGAFNSWPGPGTTGLLLTNYPPYLGGSNTNIYYGTNVFVGLPKSSASEYKFNNNDPAAPNTGWETSNNRNVTLLSDNGTLMLPVVKFSDVSVSDYSTATVAVTFVVNMTNATTYPDGHVFDPQNDQVYINGSFVSGGWSAWNPLALAQMQNDPVGSQIYTYTATVPAGSLIKVDYKYSIGYAGVTNYDNEAAPYNDHFRYIRTTAAGAYTNALDKFGFQYAEPSFGQLMSLNSAPGSVSISWLGRPGVYLQMTTNLTSIWQSAVETDGTNWSNGYSSTNGFISQTNFPASGQQFFRLIQAW